MARKYGDGENDPYENALLTPIGTSIRRPRVTIEWR